MSELKYLDGNGVKHLWHKLVEKIHNIYDATLEDITQAKDSVDNSLVEIRELSAAAVEAKDDAETASSSASESLTSIQQIETNITNIGEEIQTNAEEAANLINIVNEKAITVENRMQDVEDIADSIQQTKGEIDDISSSIEEVANTSIATMQESVHNADVYAARAADSARTADIAATKATTNANNANRYASNSRAYAATAEQQVIYATDARNAAEEVVRKHNNSIAPVENDAAADRDYSVNNMFVYDNSLYRVTRAISRDETINPGVNCEKVTIAEQLEIIAQTDWQGEIDTKADKTEVPVEYGTGVGSVKTKDFEYNGSTYSNEASGIASFAEGYRTKALSSYAHAEGATTIASGMASHAEGVGSIATTGRSHSEGENGLSAGLGSHTEGCNTISAGTYSHAEGDNSANALYNGLKNGEDETHYIYTGTLFSEKSVGVYVVYAEKTARVDSVDTVNKIVTLSETIGEINENNYFRRYSAGAFGKSAHVEGHNTNASGNYSHAEGNSTEAASDFQHVQGKFNISDSNGVYADIVGNGTRVNRLSNAYALTWTGDGKYAGDVYVHANSDSTGGDKLATESYVDTAVSNINSMSIHICTSEEYDSETEIPTITEPDASTFYLVPGGDAPNLYIEWVYVNEAWEKFGSATIDLSNYVQKTDYANQANGGVVKVNGGGASGLAMQNGEIKVFLAQGTTIKNGTNHFNPIVPAVQHQASFYGLAKAAGADEKDSELPVGQYTAEAKSAIQTMLDVPAKADIPTVPVQDVQVNGTSILDQDGIANVPVAGSSTLGTVKVNGFGLTIVDGVLRQQPASDSQIKSGTRTWEPIVPESQHRSTFYGLAKAAGDTTQSQSANAVGTYTHEAKTAIQTMLGVNEIAKDISSLKNTVSDVEPLKRVSSLNETPFAKGTVIETVGIPVYVSDVSGYAAYGLTEKGWYIFARVAAPEGVTVTVETTVIGAAGSIFTAGDDHVDIAVRFDTMAQSVPVVIQWGAATDTFIFKSSDLAVRNLDYRVTFYVYDISAYVTWSYALTTDTTFDAKKKYYTYDEGTGEYTLAEITPADPVPAYYTLAEETYTQATGVFEAGVTYYTKDGDAYTEAAVTAGDPISAYYNHSKLHIEGMPANVTYRLDETVDCPIEIVLPEIAEDGHGAWFEIQMRYNGSYSCTLLPVAEVKIGTAQTQAQSEGINTIDLQYTDVDDVKMWTLLNTHSNIPA